jgi:Domain of unknown function (DUF6985)
MINKTEMKNFVKDACKLKSESLVGGSLEVPKHSFYRLYHARMCFEPNGHMPIVILKPAPSEVDWNEAHALNVPLSKGRVVVAPGAQKPELEKTPVSDIVTSFFVRFPKVLGPIAKPIEFTLFLWNDFLLKGLLKDDCIQVEETYPPMYLRTLAAAVSLGTELDYYRDTRHFSRVFTKETFGHESLAPGGAKDSILDRLASELTEKMTPVADPLSELTIPKQTFPVPPEGAEVLEDLVFGHLFFEDVWHGKASCALAPQPVPLGIEGEPPLDSQRHNYVLFLANESQLVEKVPEAIFAYYERCGDLQDESLDKDEVLGSVRLSSIYIRETGKIGLLYRCDWEPEHGIGVLLEGAEISDVGSQDICLR